MSLVMLDESWRAPAPTRRSMTFNATGIKSLRKTSQGLRVCAHFEMEHGKPVKTYRVTVEEV